MTDMETAKVILGGLMLPPALAGHWVRNKWRTSLGKPPIDLKTGEPMALGPRLCNGRTVQLEGDFRRCKRCGHAGPFMKRCWEPYVRGLGAF